MSRVPVCKHHLDIHLLAHSSMWDVLTWVNKQRWGEKRKVLDWHHSFVVFTRWYQSLGLSLDKHTGAFLSEKLCLLGVKNSFFALKRNCEAGSLGELGKENIWGENSRYWRLIDPVTLALTVCLVSCHCRQWKGIYWGTLYPEFGFVVLCFFTTSFFRGPRLMGGPSSTPGLHSGKRLDCLCGCSDSLSIVCSVKIVALVIHSSAALWVYVHL